ncbi:YkvA family protein [Bordetella genomosp. 5]|uniref:DUF1232 domain-containing protein n=1 Tax=Bordetella genomosp. 5 TaxID=1395608 RepID=A0A261TW20_9BORD|nr:YkvA family protein [Bordetella genomosp. 5]OZI53481.1 hypothetical protein CAL25_05725 [Bordetella genomosp. 5]
MWKRIRQWARELKRDVVALWLASRDPRTPWFAKVMALIVAGYALSPIDLIPDFIPVLGLIDDLLLVPLGIWFAIRLIPPALLADLRERAAARTRRPRSLVAAIAILLLWLLAGWWFADWLWARYGR